MKYATGAAFNLTNLFEKFNLKRLKITPKLCADIRNDDKRRTFAQAMFIDSMIMILNDIIDNNITFQLPKRSRPSCIYVKRVSGEDFKLARQRGAWKDVDILASNFSGYKLVFAMYNKAMNHSRIKNIYVNPELKDKLTKYTNESKQYC